MVAVANWPTPNPWISQEDMRKRNTDTSKLAIQKCLDSRDLFFFPILLHIFELHMRLNKAFLPFSENDVKAENLIKDSSSSFFVEVRHMVGVENGWQKKPNPSGTNLLSMQIK